MSSDQAGSISLQDVDAFSADYRSDPKNLLATNFVTRTDTLQAALHRPKYVIQDHVYSVQIPDEGKPVTDQQSTGRCWMFAALNIMRIPFCNANNLDSFQFSQSYLFFWDKFERGNYFLEQILDTLSLDTDDRVVHHLLQKPTEDGGQFDMIVNLVEKYGVVPRALYPEVAATKLSRRINWLINYKLREYALILRSKASAMGDSIDYDELRRLKKEQLNEYYRLLVIHFGDPPKDFVFQARTKDKSVFRVQCESPVAFYNDYVRSLVDVQNMISLVHDPRNEPFQLYTVDRLNNMIGGARPFVKYVNLPVEKLKELAIECLRDRQQPVWFGCHVSEYFDREKGVMSMDQFDFPLLFNCDLNMNKADRLVMGESLMTHAMVFTGVDLEEKDGETRPMKWRVENSWGEKHGEKGYCMMTDDWFSQFNYQIVLDITKLPQEIADIWRRDDPVHLAPWDPMGSLAKL